MPTFFYLHMQYRMSYLSFAAGIDFFFVDFERKFVTGLQSLLKLPFPHVLTH